MDYKCPKGHISTDPDYCSECGAKIVQSTASSTSGSKAAESPQAAEICPDCGTPRIPNARFCEVCRHDFLEGKNGAAEKAVLASEGAPAEQVPENEKKAETPPPVCEAPPAPASSGLNAAPQNDIVIAQKLNVVISVDKDRYTQNSDISNVKPDSADRVFPLDLDENLVGRRSVSKSIYPEIEINDPGVSHRQMKFIKQQDGTFAALELGSANGTEYNGVQLEPGIATPIKAGDVFAIGLWTVLKVVAR